MYSPPERSILPILVKLKGKLKRTHHTYNYLFKGNLVGKIGEVGVSRVYVYLEFGRC